MKILYVVNNFHDGGAELGLLNLVENGFFTGHDLVIYAVASNRGMVRQRLLELLGPERVRSLFDSGLLPDRSLPAATMRLAKAFRAEQPDAVILSLPQANLAGRLASVVVPRSVVVSFEHTADYKRRVAHALMAVTAPFVDAIFYDHPQTWRSVRGIYRGVPEEAAHYVPLTFVEPVPVPPEIPDGRRHLVTTMRLVADKNHAELFHAMRLLVDRGYDLDLTVAGEGVMLEPLEALARELELGDRIRFVGFVNDPMSLLRRCDTFVLSSINEGLSRSVIEAMAAGLVIVSTDVGGIREYGVDGGNMIKCSGTSRDDLAVGLKTALDLGKEARTLQEGALRTVANQFAGRVVRQHWDAALSALERRLQLQAAAQA